MALHASIVSSFRNRMFGKNKNAYVIITPTLHDFHQLKGM